LQLDALVAAGVENRDVFADVISGSKTAIERPGMKKLLEYAEPGDTVVVWRVDRLGRSPIDVLNTSPCSVSAACSSGPSRTGSTRPHQVAV
jgi:DNA invertase Pin-like site-specific DNA recombinase